MSIIFLIGFIFMTVNAVLFNGQSRVIRYSFISILFILFVYITMDQSLTFDTSIYNFYYSDPDLAHFEVGYIWLMKFGKMLGLSFYQFRGLLFLIEIFLILIALHRFNIKNKNLFLLLYTILNFFESPVQLRNYLMATIVFLGFSFIKSRTKSGYMLFVLLVGLGASIQSAGLFFLPFVFFFAFQGKIMNKVVVLYTTIFISLIAFGPIRALVTVFAAQLMTPFGVTGMKAVSYLNRLMPGQIILADIPFTLGIWYFYSQIIKKFQSKDSGVNTPVVVNIALTEKLFFFLIYMFPMYLFAYNFDRILIDSFLVFFVAIVTLSDYSRTKSKSIVGVDKYTVLGIVTTLSYATFSYLYGTKLDGTLIAVLFHNTFNW
ncbi:EpsG family protein [Leuconostoc pseudomesenteroides]|uniref:EpsG family protein n=2 Tax=Leuconostoc pseudomesenteroides TaxID=33968 RepID=A0A5B8T235_LEUPS|nr:EpsG family protein [Leuconostoc pseudomesenteroides]MCC8440396.1 hypothetical protein [Leuconostoc pseudomesenteroides]QEA42731.1 hypothetical protein FGL85_09575 [Leuconostoc pseudomesenteroides]